MRVGGMKDEERRERNPKFADCRLLLPQLEDCIRCIVASAICIPRCCFEKRQRDFVSRGCKIVSRIYDEMQLSRSYQFYSVLPSEFLSEFPLVNDAKSK